MARDHVQVLAELERLVAGTYQLWNAEWVGFTWRNYTFEHAQRVRALARTLAESEGGDQLVLDYAGLLHDITKGYDGEIVTTKDGQRHLDENGFWRNDFLPPDGHNEVTRIFEDLGLAGTLHNESGARIALVLLQRRGLPDLFVRRVAEVIRAHLHPTAVAGSEERVLYDADTIDADVGLPALLRNLYINLHREEERRSRQGEDFVGWVDGRRPEFYRWWLGDKVPTWINSRRQMFLDRMVTSSARRLAERRYDRLWEWVQLLRDEIEGYEANGRVGPLAVLDCFVDCRENPSPAPLLGTLLANSNGSRFGRGRDLLELLRREMAGEC